MCISVLDLSVSAREVMAAGPDAWRKMKETRERLEKCWETDLDWSLYPESLGSKHATCNYI